MQTISIGRPPDSSPRGDRFEIVVALLEQILEDTRARDEQILEALETLAHAVDDLDRGLRPYGDGVKVHGRRR